jgi:hypothetical protein
LVGSNETKFDFYNFLQNYGNYLLVWNETDNNAWANGLLLLSIDFGTKEFKVLGKETVNNGVFKGISFDQTNPHKFAIKFYEKRDGEEYTYFMVCGSVTEDMVRIGRCNFLNVFNFSKFWSTAQNL